MLMPFNINQNKTQIFYIVNVTGQIRNKINKNYTSINTAMTHNEDFNSLFISFINQQIGYQFTL